MIVYIYSVLSTQEGLLYGGTYTTEATSIQSLTIKFLQAHGQLLSLAKMLRDHLHVVVMLCPSLIHTGQCTMEEEEKPVTPTRHTSLILIKRFNHAT